MDEERAAVVEVPGGLLESAAGIQQLGLIRVGYALQAEAPVPFDEGRNHVAAVVQIDDGVGDARRHEPPRHALEQRDAVDLHQRLGKVGGEGAQAGAASRGQDHGFHAEETRVPAHRSR